MKLSDLFEADFGNAKLAPNIEATLPPVIVIPELNSGNNYPQYRFNTIMAAARAIQAGEVKFKELVPWAASQSVVAYTPQDVETVRMAARLAGLSIDEINSTPSQEPDWVNTVSPVMKFKMSESAGDDGSLLVPKTNNIDNLSPADDRAKPHQLTPTRGLPQVVVVYPGRFQPLHKAHKAVYDDLVKQFGPNVYMATSNKTDPDSSPFDFDDKAQMARAVGIPADRMVQVKNPYQAPEITGPYEPTNTVLIFAVGEKDMEADPRFKFDVDGIGRKKDGSLSYLQKWPGLDKAKTMDQHGYVMAAPTVEFDLLGHPATSATEIRKKYRESDPEQRDKILSDLYGPYSSDMHDLFDEKLGRHTEVAESKQRYTNSIMQGISENQPNYLENPLDPEGDTNGPGKTGDQFNYDDDPVHLDDMNEGLTAQDIAIDPEEDRDRAELLKLVRQQQNLLPPRQRELIMRWADGNKLADIAKDLGIDVKSAYQLLQKALKRIRGGLAVLHGHRIGPLYGYNSAYAGRTRPFVSDNLLQMIPFVQRDPNVKIVQVNYNQFTIAPRNDSRPEVIPDIELLQQKRKLAQDYNNAVRTANQIHAEQGNTNEYMNARAAATDLLKLGRQLAKKPKFSLQPSKASVEEVNVWDKPNPVKKHKHLSDKDKAVAKARAKRAGRKYPNLVDNIWAARR